MRVPVSGIVLIDGQPLTHGNIKFVPEAGRPSLGKIEADGQFTLTCYDGGDGAIPGTHRVQVSANRVVTNTKIEWYAPTKYAGFRPSELQVEITEPVDDLRIELSSGGQKNSVYRRVNEAMGGRIRQTWTDARIVSDNRKAWWNHGSLGRAQWP